MAGKTEIQRALKTLNFVLTKGYDTEYTRKKLEELLPENQELYLDGYSAQYKIRERSDGMNVQRLKAIAYNAIVMWREDAFYDYNDDDFKEYALTELGITEEEYKEIMED